MKIQSQINSEWDWIRLASSCSNIPQEPKYNSILEEGHIFKASQCFLKKKNHPSIKIYKAYQVTGLWGNADNRKSPNDIDNGVI